MECQWGYLTSPNKHSLIFAANRNTDQWCAELHDALSSFTPKNISSEDCRVGSKTDGLFESFPFYFIPIQFPKGGFKEFKIHTLSKALRSHNVHTGNTNWTFLASLIKTATQLTHPYVNYVPSRFVCYPFHLYNKPSVAIRLVVTLKLKLREIK